jgi:DNA-directed RNA polymerase specialized sigma24 family protein
LASNLNGKIELGKDHRNKNRSKATTGFHVNRARSGDPNAFAHLYERLAPSLDAWSQLRVTGSLHEYVEPSDVIQEVWWRAMDAFDRYECAVGAESKEKAEDSDRAQEPGRSGRVTPPPALAKQTTSVGRGLSLNVSVKKLVAIVAMLSEEDRTVFMHCGLEGLTAAEAAMLVGTNADSVNKRWQRLREKLSAHPIWQDFDPSES